jgi:hypothetical protein
LPKVYQNFGSEIDMTLNPFIYGTASNLRCFDEAAPCTLEQDSMCVIQIAEQEAKEQNTKGQDVYVPWLICMDSNGDQLSTCNSQVGVSDSAVTSCVGSDSALIAEYLKTDSPIQGTPTVEINGKDLGDNLSYSLIRNALCSADPSLSGCAAPVEDGEETVVVREQVRKAAVV